MLRPSSSHYSLEALRDGEQLTTESALKIPGRVMNKKTLRRRPEEKFAEKDLLRVFRWSGTRVTCEMVSDGGGRFIPAGIDGFHTSSLSLAFLLAHDRTTEDNHTHHTGREHYRGRPILYNILVLIVGTVHKPRQGGINSFPL